MISNLLALVGLALIVVAVGALAGVWWACLAGGVALIGAAYALHTQTASAPEPAAGRAEP